MNQSLLPLTKLVLAVSAIVQVVFALAMLFAPSVVQSFAESLPDDPRLDLWLRYNAVHYAVLYIAMALGAVYALRQNRWSAARTYLVIAGSYVAMCVVVVLFAAVTSLPPPGMPRIFWLYVGLSLLYLPLVVWVWRQQSGRARPAQAEQTTTRAWEQ